MKYVRIILIPEAADAYNSLISKAPESKQKEIILNAFLLKVELLKENIHYGQPIDKKLIPAEYKTRYGIANLFRVELPNFWRMLYTLTAGSSGIEILVLVLDIIDELIPKPIFSLNYQNYSGLLS